MRLAEVTTLLSLALMVACDGQSRLERCLEYDDRQTIADCADHLRSEGLLDEAALVRFLNGAIAKFALKAGSQPLQQLTRELCFESRLLDASPVGTSKPLLLYLVGDVPAFRPWHVGATPESSSRSQLFPAYSGGPKVRRFNSRIKKSCGDYHKWLTSNLVLWEPEPEPERFAVAMDPSLWCPDSFVDLVVPVVAKLAESSFDVLDDESARRVYRLEWAVWKGGTHGQVPARFLSVFN